MHRLTGFVLLALLAACAGPTPQAAGAGAATAIPPGLGQQTAELGGTALTVYTYRPDGCTPAQALIVFHGLQRNASTYRDNARPLGQRLCMVVVAPLFDEARFPTASYQRGGLVRDGQLLPQAEWTVGLVPRLMAWVRAREGNPALPIALLGHSAGAQFLSRVAAFVPNDSVRMVVADPSTWIWPSLDRDVPYGLGGVYPADRGEAELRRYLAEPITVLLGGNDVGARNLARSRQAEEQGGTRLDRGENAFLAAQQSAARHGWPFGWRRVIAPGIAHDAHALFASDKALEALAP